MIRKWIFDFLREDSPLSQLEDEADKADFCYECNRIIEVNTDHAADCKNRH
jgi:hypothetical protein